MDGSCIHHLPNLHDVVLGDWADDPGFIGIPGEVRDLGCVATMDELIEKKVETQNIETGTLKTTSRGKQVSRISEP